MTEATDEHLTAEDASLCEALDTIEPEDVAVTKQAAWTAADRIRALSAEAAELRKRLEVDGSGYDGIAARDETIRQLEARP